MMRRSLWRGRAGFSLVEIIAVLLLIGLLGVLTTPLLGKVIRAAVQGSVEQQTAEEAYWAVSRMTTLLGLAVTADTSVPQQLTIGLYDPNTSTTNLSTLAFSNGQITYDGVLFWDQVNAFDSSFSNHLFHVGIRLVDANHPTISLDVFARNTL